MNMQKIFPKGTTSREVVIRVINQLSSGPNTGVDETTSGLVLSYRRDGEIAVSIAISNATLSFLTSPWTAGGIQHIDSGYYRVDVPDAAFAKAVGVNNVLITGTLTGGNRVEGCMIQLTDTNVITASTPNSY